MKIQSLSLAGIVIGLLLSSLVAAEKKIQAKDLPPAVQKAVQAEVRGGTIKGYAREVDNGKTMFEVETMRNGHSRDLLFDANGTLVQVEEAMSFESVPGAVKSALESRGRVLKVEQVTRGSSVTYEGVVQKNGKKSEVAVTADGMVAKP
jgi:uncharacterized membrane protein YkoI